MKSKKPKTIWDTWRKRMRKKDAWWYYYMEFKPKCGEALPPFRAIIVAKDAKSARRTLREAAFHQVDKNYGGTYTEEEAKKVGKRAKIKRRINVLHCEPHWVLFDAEL